MSVCARSVHPSVRVGACLCMSSRACARERRRNTTARPLDVCHHVCMCMCACARGMHLSVGGRGRGRARARTRLERASTNCVSLRTFYIDVYLYMNVGMYGCRIVCLCMCVCV